MHGLIRRTIAGLAAAWVIAAPPAGALAATTATPKQAVVKSVSGPTVACKRWGKVQVRIAYKKVIATVAGRKRTTVKILRVEVPVAPNGTAKTRYINKQVMPLLIEEALSIQSANVEMISGATDTTVSFNQSLQGALFKAAAL